MTVLNVKSEAIRVSTKGNTDVIDVTKDLEAIVKRSGVESGIVTLFVVGSTAGLTTIEFEPGLVKDMKTTFDAIAPQSRPYEHHLTWGDDNGHSHVRAALLGPSVTIPFNAKKLSLGTWQQVVLIDFDTRPREREIVCQILGK